MGHLTKATASLMAIVLSTLCSCVGTNNFSTNDRASGFTLEVTRNNYIPRHYKKILIESSGTSPTRLFFDNLYAALSADLLKKNVTTEKEFKTNDSFHISYPIDKFRQLQPYDAVLMISPISAEDTEENMTMDTDANQFGHIFKFTVFDRQAKNNPVWELSLNINVDFTQSEPYQKLAEKILENMKQDKLVQ